MTEAVRRPRASKRELRAWAWVAGALAFVAPAAVFGAVPKPPQDAQATTRPDIVIRKITRRIVITRPAAAAPVRYVTAGSTSASSGVASAPAAASTGGS